MNEPENWSEAQLWLRYAHEDIRAADELIKSIITPRHICFLAQQSAEKAIKAVLIFEQINFPKSHDLEALVNLVPSGWAVKGTRPSLSILTEWAIEARYPGNWPEATIEEARAALDIAKEVYNSVTRDFETRGLMASF